MHIDHYLKIKVLENPYVTQYQYQSLFKNEG